MATAIVQTAFATGEVSPSLFGRVDLDKERIAASTMRNIFVGYRGGVNSRAGTKFVGFSKQTGRDFPPRLIPFQFSINQSLALEFGHHYMRVISNGRYVTESPVAIGGVTRSNPAVITFGAQGATAATPNNGSVSFSYAPGDLVTLAGGTSLTEAVLAVTTSELHSILANNPGTGYTVADTITLGGGSHSAAAVVTVASLVSTAASGSILFSVNPSPGDTITLNGVTWTFVTTVSAPAETAISPTLDQTLAQLVTDLNASVDASLIVATYSADLTTLFISFDVAGTGGNAYALAASVATPSGGTLTGGSTTGVGNVTVTTPGVYTALPVGGNMTETATSGGGGGSSFQTAVFAPHAVTISNPGAYSALPSNPVAQDSTTGTGLGATFTVTWAAVPAFSNDDWVFISGVGGMTELNGNTYRLAGVSGATAQLHDVYGNPVNSTAFAAYTGGGTASRIFTLPTPYDEQDLDWLKFTQSADVMTICCVNQETEVEYAPQDLSRFSDTSWVFTPVVPEPSVSAPGSLTATGNSAGLGFAYFYQYTVTAISSDDGTESTPSPVAHIQSSLLSTVVQIQVTWGTVTGVNQYNVYRTYPNIGSDVPAGSLFGLIGSAYGNQFTDTNLAPDFGTVPPRHQDPFARGHVLSVHMITGGSGYNQATVAAVITTGTGSGANLIPVVVNGAIVAVIVQDMGKNYLPSDTIHFTGGSGATGTLSIGPESGTYPSVAGYFQQRRVFANSINLPDTYNMSEPGAFTNFDTRLPTIDTDAITGSPWSVQVDGIQFMLTTAAGLLMMTGQAAWLLVGNGSFATNVQPISPDSQAANPQPFTGCSATVPPIKINFNVVYVTAKGSFYYELPYQGYSFTEPLDLTEYSAHLFVDFTVRQNAWCEQPYKLLWSVRNDGTMESLTYLKAEGIAGWARHDTNGYFESVCSVTEPPVDALYLAVQRFPGNNTAYMIERMDNRIWPTVEDCWCVDSGLALGQPTPNGTLTADSPTGIGAIIGVTALVGGTGYSASTVAQIIDTATDENNDPIGSGATATLTIVVGVITAVNITAPGSGYVYPRIDFYDPQNGGAGASAHLTLDTRTIFRCTTGSFVIGDVGSVIRMGGGIATITAFTSSSVVTAQITTPITAIRTNSGGQVQPQPTGQWTLTKPVTVVSGLLHLAGATVTGLADGNVITPRVVSPTGTVTLDAPASSIVIGLGFQAQLQSVYLDAGSPTVQGQRKKIAAASVLVQNSRSVELGINQVDGSTLSPPQLAPEWQGMTQQPDLLKAPYNSSTKPLYTGWIRDATMGGFAKPGQIALQQNDPLPLDILSIVPEALLGDLSSQNFPKRGQQQGASQ